MLVVIKIVKVALFALAVRRSEIGGAANARGVSCIVAVGAGAGSPGRNSAMGLIRSCEWRNGGVVAALAVLCCRGLSLIDQHACRVVVGVARKAGVRAVAGLAVTATCRNGGDVSPSGVSGQSGVNLDIFMARGTGALVEKDWTVRQVTGADAIRRIENPAGTRGAVVGGVKARHETIGYFVAVITGLCV